MGGTSQLPERFEALLNEFQIVSARPQQAVEQTAGSNLTKEFEQLLLAFDRLPEFDQKPAKTLLEIAGVDESELSCSRILAFFLDPEEKHQLGDLTLKALIELFPTGEAYSSNELRGVAVDPEVQ